VGANLNTTYSIIAGAALQFIDYDIDLSAMHGRWPLAKRRKPFHVTPGPAGGKDILIDLEEQENNPGEFIGLQSRRPMPLHYEVEVLEAFNCCAGQWLPLPFLVRDGFWADRSPRYGYGPTDWVRGYLSRLGGDDSLKFRLTLVFDAQVEDGSANIVTEDGAVIYHALSPEDVSNNVSYGLASGERDNAWFINELPWVKEALGNCLEGYRRRYPRRTLARVAEDFPLQGYENSDPERPVRTEDMAVYCTFLEGLTLSGQIGEVRVINPAKAAPIEVDLVLDIGNSRLTGVLVATPPQQETMLNHCHILPIRDLSEPSKVYEEPVDTQVEFAEPFFGKPEWSLDSRRHNNSFPWPSTVRLGPEARRLAHDSREDMGPTGMSSPKRYLWDTRQRDMLWYLNNKYEHHGELEERAAGRGAFLMSVNVAGVPLAALRPGEGGRRAEIPAAIKSGYGPEDDMVAFEPRYSRSSLMMFLLSEIVAQALSAVNCPMKREDWGNANTPRRLSRILLTVPTAMPLVEQNIFKTWARLAVETVWSAMGWEDFYRPDHLKKDGPPDFRQSPLVRCDWDEATCTQVVWLFNEVRERFHNNAEELFSLLGRRRLVPGDREADPGREALSLRIASIDMGGGTTDLSITTYAIHNPGLASPLIKPHHNFRDGFNVAGDDIMHKVIRGQFIKKIAAGAAEAGVRDAESLVAGLFAESPQPDPAIDERLRRQLRSQFVSLVAAPLALKILKAYEGADLSGDDLKISLNIGEALNLKDQHVEKRMAEVLGYLEGCLRRNGWSDFSLIDYDLSVDLREVHQDVNSIVEKIMSDMGEVVRLYDCDLLILTGRPSRWPALMQAPYRKICLPVDRIVHMHKYRVGASYPFVTHGRIEDPKTTVVVGAIICALAEGSLEGITIDSSAFEPQPTTRYIGMLDGQGRLTQERVWFSDIDVYSKEELNLSRDIDFNAPVPVGFRQLSSSRWTTTRLYRLEFRNAALQRESAGRAPYKVKLEYSLREFEEQDEAPRRKKALRRTEGSLKVLSITDKFDQPLPNSTLAARLQTLRNDEGYWLDTGVLDEY